MQYHTVLAKEIQSSDDEGVSQHQCEFGILCCAMHSYSHLPFVSVFIRETPSNQQASLKRSIAEVARAADEDTNNASRSRRPRITRESPDNSVKYTWASYKAEILATNFDSEMDGIPIMLRILQDTMGIMETFGSSNLQPTLKAIDSWTQQPYAIDVFTIIDSLVANASHAIDDKYHTWGSMWSQSNHGMRAVSNSEDIYSLKLFAQMESRFGSSSSCAMQS